MHALHCIEQINAWVTKWHGLELPAEDAEEERLAVEAAEEAARQAIAAAEEKARQEVAQARDDIVRAGALPAAEDDAERSTHRLSSSQDNQRLRRL